MSVKRNHHPVSLKDLSNAIARLEGRLDVQEKTVQELKADMVPLHETMLQVRGAVRLVSIMVAGIGLVGTLAEIVHLMHGRI